METLYILFVRFKTNCVLCSSFFSLSHFTACCTVALLHCCTVARCYVIHWKLETKTFILFITNIPYDAFFRQHYFTAPLYYHPTILPPHYITTPLFYHPTKNLMAAPKPLFTEIKIFWRSTRFVDEYLYIQPKKHKTKFRIMFNC